MQKITACFLQNSKKMLATQINVKDAFELLKKDQDSVLIDVRTLEELNFVGSVNAEFFDNRLIFLPWQIWPRMDENPDFAIQLEESLQEIFGNNFKETKIIFLCRTGGRSNQAANYALNLGYKSCYNLVAGFEGDLNQEGHRGTINGWKANNLPWRQK